RIRQSEKDAPSRRYVEDHTLQQLEGKRAHTTRPTLDLQRLRACFSLCPHPRSTLTRIRQSEKDAPSRRYVEEHARRPPIDSYGSAEPPTAAAAIPSSRPIAPAILRPPSWKISGRRSPTATYRNVPHARPASTGVSASPSAPSESAPPSSRPAGVAAE